ncbi:hypothetical protein HO173_001939 [Letharia columbiana]|uniref:Uncharacterized protein n=1 Tax=Letharia columbiana TaxID=112416 RepID=A0A8H6L9B1_9LECA|nr:uncharacterized protein HO173_001939 [Letharia columbiana]KAF6240328.1 hypothetical protein HO173_001939 [Letharia columbiana]
MAGNVLVSSQKMTPRETSSQTLPTSSAEHDSLVPLHPLRIRPAGNAYTATEDIKMAAGSFAALPDELLIQVLESLDAASLKWLGCACKALYAFSRLEELWKTLCIESSTSIVAWRGTWRSTYFNLPETCRSQISCQNLFSDVLHRPFLCAHTSLVPYTSNIPARNAIPRLQDLSTFEFSHAWTDRPFILTDPVREWPVYREWSTEAMLGKYGDVSFRAEAVDWPLKTYVEYMNDNQDESPLYLFDRSFVEKMDIRVGKDGQYRAPGCFGEDLFSVLGEQRPDSRWLIVGPERSGSTFHKDPNATSAWNAVLRGSKYWIMFPTSPSQPPPPGVFVSEDQSEVTSPLSIAEWMLGFHAQAKAMSGCAEGICKEGEVLHVPSGWWHLVVNLSPSIAITQNFVPQAHLVNVLDFLKTKPDQVSGFHNDINNPYELFVEKMRGVHPEVLDKALGEMEKIHGGKKRKWDQLVNGDDEHVANANAFNFGFGDDDAEDVP